MEWALLCDDGTAILLPKGDVFAAGVLRARLTSRLLSVEALSGLWDVPEPLHGWFSLGHQVGVISRHLATQAQPHSPRAYGRVPLNLRDIAPIDGSGAPCGR
jgi:hypothetical protein